MACGLRCPCASDLNAPKPHERRAAKGKGGGGGAAKSAPAKPSGGGSSKPSGGGGGGGASKGPKFKSPGAPPCPHALSITVGWPPQACGAVHLSALCAVRPPASPTGTDFKSSCRLLPSRRGEGGLCLLPGDSQDYPDNESPQQGASRCPCSLPLSASLLLA